MDRMKTIILMAIFALAVNVSWVQASTINFDGLAGTSMIGMTGSTDDLTYFFGPDSMVDGFVFSASKHYYLGSIYANDGPWPSNNTDYLLAASPLTIRESNDNLFNLNSFDLTEWGEYSNKTYTVTGYLAGGDTVSETITLDNFIHQEDVDYNDFNHFNFTKFTNLSSVTIAGYSYFALDNLNVSPIPEPTTMLLLGAGLIGLAGFRRKFKKS